MDYKKLYKEALENAKGIINCYKEHNRGDESAIEDLEIIFPELKESEDERIRKDIISFLRSKNGYMNPDEDWDFHNRWLPWLEKQEKLPEGCVRRQVAEAKEALYSAPCADTINGQGITNQLTQSVTKTSEQVWSEEDENELYIVISTIESRAMVSQLEQYTDMLYKSVEWLKSIKQRLGGK